MNVVKGSATVANGEELKTDIFGRSRGYFGNDF